MTRPSSWRTNGFAPGPQYELFPGYFGSRPAELTIADGRMYFSAEDYLHGWELFSLDPVDHTATEAVAREEGTLILRSGYPNPFTTETTVVLDGAGSSQVRVDLYDVVGRRVRTLYDGWADRDALSIVIDGAGLAKGVYFVVARASDGSSVVRVARQ